MRAHTRGVGHYERVEAFVQEITELARPGAPTNGKLNSREKERRRCAKKKKLSQIATNHLTSSLNSVLALLRRPLRLSCFLR